MNVGDKVWFRPSGAKETIDGMVIELEMARGLVEGTVVEVLSTLVPSVVVTDEEGEEHVVLVQNLRERPESLAENTPRSPVEAVGDALGGEPGVAPGLRPTTAEIRSALGIKGTKASKLGTASIWVAAAVAGGFFIWLTMPPSQPSWRNDYTQQRLDAQDRGSQVVDQGKPEALKETMALLLNLRGQLCAKVTGIEVVGEGSFKVTCQEYRNEPGSTVSYTVGMN